MRLAQLPDPLRRVARLLLLLAMLAACAPASAEQNVVIYAYDKLNSVLLRYFSQAPAILLSSTPITGLSAGEEIVGMDFRPATGELYAVSGNGSAGRLNKIDTTTGAITRVGAAGVFTVDSGASVGAAFTAVQDRIRVVSTTESNKRLNPNDGTVSNVDFSLFYIAGDPGFGANPSVGIIANDNHYLGATSTTVYGIDTARNTLVFFNNASVGELATIGSLGITLNSVHGGMAIQPGTNTAYAALTPTPGITSSLYRINLVTGAATLLGAFSTNNKVIDSIAIGPASPCLDIDGDGRVDALSDGLALLRAFFGLTGTAVTSGAVPAGAPRNDWTTIRAHLNSNCGLHLGV